jgi:hypothetical protein
MNIDLTKNVKQAEYFNAIFKSTITEEYKYFAYGGAIRGGKTFVTLASLILLCKKYPNSRWVVVRDTFPSLEKTTIPSMSKLLGDSQDWFWRRDKSNFFVRNTKTGGTIFFYAENIKNDPELNSFLGLECNGFFLEQSEELSEKTWSKCLERAGSWYIDPMPPPFIFTTFNPNQGWTKAKFYDPYIKGNLAAPYYFIQALPDDNPFVTKNQWDGWRQLDSVSYARFITGDWNSFPIENPFCYAFDEGRHVKPVEYDPFTELCPVFDFNKDPLTCVLWQNPEPGIMRAVKEYRMMNGDIEQLCERIIADYPDALFIVTGDATGQARSALTRGNTNYYTIIRHKLRLGDVQMKVPSVNPSVRDTRVLLNSLLQNGGVEIDPRCEFLIKDLKYVQVDDKGDIIKDRSDGSREADFVDITRYNCWTFHRKWLKYMND